MVGNDKNLIDSLEKLRKKIYDDTADVLIEGLKEGKISMQDSEKMARFVNTIVPVIKNKSEAVTFLDMLMKRWDVYKNVCTIIKYQQKEEETQEKLQQIQQKLYQFTSKI